MELTEPKTLGILDHHHRSIGHIDADFDDGRCHKDLGLAGRKTLHLEIFVRGFHLTMYHGDLIFRKRFAQLIKTVLQVLQIEFLVLLNKRIDDIDLPSFLYLFAKESIDLCAALYREWIVWTGLRPGGNSSMMETCRSP